MGDVRPRPAARGAKAGARYATRAEVHRLNRQLAQLRHNPLVRLGAIANWAHVWRALFSLIVVGGSLAEILRLVMGR